MLIVDSENIFENTLSNLNEMDLGYNFTITTEKTSKIIETLVTSTTPRTIVLGKTI